MSRSILDQESNKLCQLVQLFERLFFVSHNTQLVPGGEEPFYQAATACAPAMIISRADYFSSALHEVAHWCVAGKQRRLIDDYGYWYSPDGRNEQQQRQFEQVEVKPQAIEWAFSLACGHEFHFSADNLNGGNLKCNHLNSSNHLNGNNGCSPEFESAVRQQLSAYLLNGLPTRAQQLFDAMEQAFITGPNKTKEALLRKLPTQSSLTGEPEVSCV